MDNQSNRKEFLELLLKEYDLMRSEVRMYINKQYLALTAILAILTAGIFKADPETNRFIYVWIPFAVAGIISFIAMVSFFINKTAGYLRLIEARINRLYSTSSPMEPATKDYKLAPMLWETFYADVGMDRDKGAQLRSIFGSPLSVLLFTGLLTVSYVIKCGYEELGKDNIVFAIIYSIASVVILASSIYSFWYVNTNVRLRVRKINHDLMEHLDPI